MSESFEATAFVVKGDWGPETRKHPATKFMEIAQKEFFDQPDHSNRGDFETDDLSVITPHAHHNKKGREVVHEEDVENFYRRPLSKYRHEPFYQIVVETTNGWDLHATFYLFGNVAGDRHHSEQHVTDSEGTSWDIKIPIYYNFQIEKDPKAKYGMKLSHVTFIKDTGVINAKLEKRGHGHRKSYKH